MVRDANIKNAELIKTQRRNDLDMLSLEVAEWKGIFLEQTQAISNIQLVLKIQSRGILFHSMKKRFIDSVRVSNFLSSSSFDVSRNSWTSH